MHGTRRKLSGVYLAEYAGKVRMRFGIAILLVSAWTGRCEMRDVVKNAEVDKLFAGTGQSLEVLAKTNYGVVFRVSSGGPGARQTHPDADEFWFVRHGAAKVSLGPGASDFDGRREGWCCMDCLDPSSTRTTAG